MPLNSQKVSTRRSCKKKKTTESNVTLNASLIPKADHQIPQHLSKIQIKRYKPKRNWTFFRFKMHRTHRSQQFSQEDLIKIYWHHLSQAAVQARKIASRGVSLGNQRRILKWLQKSGRSSLIWIRCLHAKTGSSRHCPMTKSCSPATSSTSQMKTMMIQKGNTDSLSKHLSCTGWGKESKLRTKLWPCLTLTLRPITKGSNIGMKEYETSQVLGVNC